MTTTDEILKKREEKRARAAALNAQFFAEQKAKLEEHLRIAREAAEAGKKASVAVPPVSKAPLAPAAEQKAEPSAAAEPKPVAAQPTPPPAPKIRMAPGYKPKPIAVAQTFSTTGLSHARRYRQTHRS